jgi:hypothetical protein
MIHFAYNNRVDAALISASSQAAGLPATNVAQIWKSRPWRSTGCTDEWIKFDFGAAAAVRAFLAVGFNLTPYATVRIQANATDVWTSPSIDVALTYHAAVLLYLWSSDQSYRFWRLSIVDPGNPDGYIEIGRIFLGQTATPDRNFKAWSREPIDPTTIVRSYDGAESFERRTAYDLLTFEFGRVLTSTFDDLFRAVGLRTYFFVIADYDSILRADGRHDLSRYVRFDEPPAYAYGHRDRDDVDIKLLEAL